MTRLLRPLGRYAQVGLLCAVLNTAGVAAMDHLGFGYAACVAAAFLPAASAGYLLNALYTFGAPLSLAGWGRFVVASLCGFPLSMASMTLLCGALGLRASAAIVVATAIQFGWNYLLAQWLLGRRRSLA